MFGPALSFMSMRGARNDRVNGPEFARSTLKHNLMRVVVVVGDNFT